MTTERISPPAALVVSMDEARRTLRLDADNIELDPTIEVWIKGITKEAEHSTGRAFVNRPMRVTLDRFQDAIRLSAPTYSVESVKYLDRDGQLQTLDPADYYVDKVTNPGYVVQARGKAWPATAEQVNAVMVEYIAGYGPTEASVPEEAKLYVLARLAELFDPAAREFRETQASVFVTGLLDSLRMYRL